MAVILVTGKPGQGKTHFVMKKYVNEAVKEGRPVYTNIDGCNLDVYPIPKNNAGEMDWLLTPESDVEHGHKGSLVIYDETQRLTDNKDDRYFAWKGREKISEREVIRELEYHRHSGRDIIFITQSPKLLHLHLLELVNEHYHCTRLRNEKRSQVSLWRSWQEKPDSVAATERAEDVFFVPFDEQVFTQYKSTVEVTDGKARIPKYMYKLAAIAVVAFIISIGLFANIFFHFGDGHRIGQNAIAKATESKENMKNLGQGNKAQPQDKTAQENLVLDQQCSKQYGLTVEQCADLRDPNKRNQQMQQTNDVRMSTIEVQYNPNKPYDVDVSNVQYQVTEKPVFSGCMKKGSRYVAYTQQGTILSEVSQSDCKRLINQAGDRPFNYFRTETVASKETKKPENEDIKPKQQPIQYANNYIQPGLERKTDGANDLGNFSF
ncbi:zonular occludens toxin domain-containing protein [Acinetobacter seifertii]|uniref:zonular occludens toxin domain-containing protein n=1 Tax=Acinetobacter seifertii TaxID=1530123 RepID=UPI00168D40CC|nr:hypothetical protein IC763_09985 [Acinetobacter seifertii]